MTVATPAFLGMILRKNARTERFIVRETGHLLQYFPGMSRGDLNEDSRIIGLSIAMNGADLNVAVNELEKDGAVLGQDFVPTSSHAGVLGGLAQLASGGTRIGSIAAGRCWSASAEMLSSRSRT
jgi:hypothetical protein